MAARRHLASLATAIIGLTACADHAAPAAYTPANATECEVPTPCPQFGAFPQGPGQPEPTQYTEGQSCALESLNEGSAQLLHYSTGCEGSCYGEAFLVRPDGSVLRQDYYADESDPAAVDFDSFKVVFEDWSEAEQCLLKDSAYFEACLSAFDESCAYVGNWVTDCITPSVVSCG